MLEPEQLAEYTAVGTVRCLWCKAEWIGQLDEHDDPVCMMWVMRWDMREE